MTHNIKRIIELTKYLNICSIKYYNGMNTISDAEFDKLLEELSTLEINEGFLLPNSPTSSVGARVLNEISRVNLPYKMLSLNKIKNDYEKLNKWIGDKTCLMSVKVDGAACAIEYKNGVLIGAYTRGDGTVGSNVTDIVSTLPSVPNIIKNKGHIVVIGEICIKKNDFDSINSSLEDNDKYSNPRNLASATLTNLDITLGKKRRLTFYAFDIQGEQRFNNQLEVLTELNSFGYMTALNTLIDATNSQLVIESYKVLASQKGIPIDGVVIRILDRNEYEIAGATSKYPKGAVAFKFEDDVEETVINDIEWSIGRTGVLTPVMIVEPTEIYDTIVSRISGHNLSYLKLHEVGIGDKILFTKSNEIIPMLVENVTRSNNICVPVICPYCGSKLHNIKENDSETIICKNNKCKGILSKKIEFYADRNNMNIKGLSEETVKALVYTNKISCIYDLYNLTIEDVLTLPNFSTKKAVNLIQAIRNSRNDIEMHKFITSVGIESIGATTAKAICKYYNNNLDDILNAKEEDLCRIDGISTITARAIVSHLEEDFNRSYILYISKFLNFSNKENVQSVSGRLSGLSFCITGRLEKFSSRKELASYIENNGGKIVSGVNSKTNYLVNNNINSISSKNKEAQRINIPIITEEELIIL